MATLATKFHTLPDGVRGVIYEFLPRHDTATLIAESINKRYLRLRYVRTRYIPTPNHVPSIYWDHRITPISTMFIIQNELKIAKHLKELRPTKLLCDTYGNGSIKRVDISVGEKARLRAIKQGLSRLHVIS